MKKVLLSLVIAGIFAGASFGAGLKIGMHPQHNMPPEGFRTFVQPMIDGAGWMLLKTDHTPADEFVYFDSLPEMMMALHAGKVDDIGVPWPVGEYIVNTDADTEICCAIHSGPWHLALGFRNDDVGKKLCAAFNDALASMIKDGRLSTITAKYLAQPGKTPLLPATFTRFPDAETVRVAVTGDMPPLDAVAANGTPVGFNTAVLAEIGRRAGVNIELVGMSAGARTNALTSGRVDAVFWYQVWHGVGQQPDVPEGVLLSEAYFEWDTALHIRHVNR